MCSDCMPDSSKCIELGRVRPDRGGQNRTAVQERGGLGGDTGSCQQQRHESTEEAMPGNARIPSGAVALCDEGAAQ